MIKALLSVALSTSLWSLSSAECANGCNGHGRCTSYDMCICNRNWQANDCSERICQFGLAHVDTPKGDLNMDGVISGPDIILVENSFAYPFGTTEQFPRMQDTDLTEDQNSAHYYMECSNKGTCNRKTGECDCFDGYDGAACQRASCPGYPKSCSGHGVCKTIKQLAAADYDNIYELWDKDSTMGCECDAGFYGPDCSLRECKYGVDPLYLDDTATIKHAVFHFAVLTTRPVANFTDGMTDSSPAYFKLKFYDMHGEDWETRPILAGSDCATVVAALNELPNDVIPGTMSDDQCILATAEGQDPLAWFNNDFTFTSDSYDFVDRSIITRMAFWINDNYYSSFEGSSTFSSSSVDRLIGYYLSGSIYRIHFDQTPGKLREPEINVYLDGPRPTITDPDKITITKVWTDGLQGENIDYFGDHCDDVTASITINDRGVAVLENLTSTEKELLKYCLADSDFDVSNNVEIYNWDYGSSDYPHIIKLVKTTASMNEGGLYAALFYDSDLDLFKLINPVYPNHESDLFEIYTTKGTLARTSNLTSAVFDFASNKLYMTNSSLPDSAFLGSGSQESEWDKLANWNGDLSCETVSGTSFVKHCLNKSDIITFLAANDTLLTFGYGINHNATSPARINLYTVEKLHQETYVEFSRRVDYPDVWPNVGQGQSSGTGSVAFGDRAHVITTDLSTNWAAANPETTPFFVYKFFPSADSSYTYVAQCSNRGICNDDEGLCECFAGYTGDACSDQNSLAV